MTISSANSHPRNYSTEPSVVVTVEINEPREGEGQQGHEAVLRTCTNQYVEWPAKQNSKVGMGEREAHGEHDESEEEARHITPYPGEEHGETSGRYGGGYDESRRVGCEQTAY